MSRLLWIGAVVVLATAIALFFTWLPGRVHASLNPVGAPGPYSVPPRIQRLHGSLLVADLHSDALLWSSDLRVRNRIGHVDVPRLIQGNVAIQAFTTVTKTPAGMNLERNDSNSDRITLLTIAQRWPMRSWTSLLERALYQAEKLRRLAETDDRFTLLESAADLDAYLSRRQDEAFVTAGFLGIEGAHALEHRLENVDRLFDAGFRMFGLVHFFDNRVGGSAHGIDKGGLTDFGRRVVARIEQLGGLVDLAHASPTLINDVLEIATRPVLVSHTGVRATCDTVRNLTDAQLRRIADNGGLVGIGFWPSAVCGTDAAAIARAMAHAVQVMGPDHVALGSDFDGAVAVPFDASGMALLTEALVRAGMAEPVIRQVMGDNVVRVLRQQLPATGTTAAAMHHPTQEDS